MRRGKPTMGPSARLLAIARAGRRAARLLFSRNERKVAPTNVRQTVPDAEIGKWLASPGLRPPA